MRGLAQRWRPRGIRPPVPAGRHALPLALAALAVVAAASTSASAARVTGPDGAAAPSPVAAGVAPDQLVPPFLPPAGARTSATAPSGAGRAPAAGGGGAASPSEVADEFAANGIPTVALEAYQAAERQLADEDPGCGISWSLLAAIGRVESNHGRYGGSALLRDGRSDPPILGIPLDGRPGVARIGDTDGGRYDGDVTYDRAVGPMQFIPGTWAMFSVDGDGDGQADPFDVDDVAVAAARYLCKAGGDLRTLGGQRDAVYSYNRSDEYVRLVLDLAAEYARGVRVDDLPAPDRTPRPLPPPKKPTLPPGTVGSPPAASASATPKQTATPTRPAPTSTTAPTTTAPGTTPSRTTAPGTTAPGTTAPGTTAPGTTPPSTTPAPTCTPGPTPTGTQTGTPTGTPTTTPSPTPTPTPTPTGTPSGTPTPTPTPLPTCPA